MSSQNTSQLVPRWPTVAYVLADTHQAALRRAAEFHDHGQNTEEVFGDGPCITSLDHKQTGAQTSKLLRPAKFA